VIELQSKTEKSRRIPNVLRYDLMCVHLYRAYETIVEIRFRGGDTIGVLSSENYLTCTKQQTDYENDAAADAQRNTLAVVLNTGRRVRLSLHFRARLPARSVAT